LHHLPRRWNTTTLSWWNRMRQVVDGEGWIEWSWNSTIPIEIRRTTRSATSFHQKLNWWKSQSSSLSSRKFSTYFHEIILNPWLQIDFQTRPHNKRRRMSYQTRKSET
jgi:hypothetical protein